MGFDFLYAEFNVNHPTEGGSIREQKGPYPHYGGTDDYLTNCFSRNPMEALLRAGEIEQETVDLIRGWELSGFHVFTGEPIGANTLAKIPDSLFRSK